MSREIENITASFRKARQSGETLLSEGHITYEDFCDVMLSYELQLKELGATF